MMLVYSLPMAPRKPSQFVGTDDTVLSILSGLAHSRRALAS